MVKTEIEVLNCLSILHKILNRNIVLMAWYFNFCAPTIPNDSIINGNRIFQACCLLFLLFIYICIYAYYIFFKPVIKQKNQPFNIFAKKNRFSSSSSDDKDSNSNNQEDENKTVEIGKEADQNCSYMALSKTKRNIPSDKSERRKTQKKSEYEKNNKENQPLPFQNLKEFFPIVFGHFAIACSFDIMYSPRSEQSLAMVLYIFFFLIMALGNEKNCLIMNRTLWILMCIINCFLLVSGLLELGQTNFNVTTNQCFLVNYKPLY